MIGKQAVFCPCIPQTQLCSRFLDNNRSWSLHLHLEGTFARHPVRGPMVWFPSSKAPTWNRMSRVSGKANKKDCYFNWWLLLFSLIITMIYIWCYYMKFVYSNCGLKTGGDNSNKRCFRTKPKLFRESGDFSGNGDTWKFFRETRDNSGTLQKKIGTSRNFISHFYLKFRRMIQISGTT